MWQPLSNLRSRGDVREAIQSQTGHSKDDRMTRTDERWPVAKLAILLYPFAAAAVAINLFMLGLMWQAIGLPAISPMLALWLCVPLGIPAGWWAARWVRGLMDEADGVKPEKRDE